jgi:hypothetical protein
VLLVFGAPGQLKTLAGQEHGRTIPLTDIQFASRQTAICIRSQNRPRPRLSAIGQQRTPQDVLFCV